MEYRGRMIVPAFDPEAEPLSDEPVDPALTVRELMIRRRKRTAELFDMDERPPVDEASTKLKLAIKIADEYAHVRNLPEFVPGQAPAAPPREKVGAAAAADAAKVATVKPPFGHEHEEAIPGLDAAKKAKKAGKETDVSKLIDSIDEDENAKRLGAAAAGIKGAITTFKGEAGSVVNEKKYLHSAQVIPRLASKWHKPEWHAPWKLYRVISGHQGWVRSVTVDPSNEWFATGSADRTIKIWDLASGQLKLTLTGHIEQVTGIAVSDRHPYMFTCALDKMVKCWDLEYNKVIRHYHGHLSGVYSLALHPELDVLMTGGRDSACRVWDMRTKLQAMCLTGHDSTVAAIASQREEPQVITGSYDSTVKLWDLAAGKCRTTLTYHKKGVRALALHPKDFSLLSASADNIKKFALPHGKFMHNMLSQQKTIVNSLSANEDDVVVSGGDNGSVWFWDYKSGHNFQQAQPKVQPGSMESEAGIFASAFDRTGTRLITVEADKTIKMWKEDEDATPETHPNLPYHPPRELRRY